jgi:hypothetical protein
VEPPEARGILVAGAVPGKIWNFSVDLRGVSAQIEGAVCC